MALGLGSHAKGGVRLRHEHTDRHQKWVGEIVFAGFRLGVFLEPRLLHRRPDLLVSESFELLMGKDMAVSGVRWVWGDGERGRNVWILGPWRWVTGIVVDVCSTIVGLRTFRNKRSVTLKLSNKQQKPE